ncbi:MAG TPA: HAD family hydrolase [Candidatus Woesearchaeota archaeon]|jgi:putative hydrolase of the HAD superfamily|nr:HAD family hydrolase [Candidatus Woesearchaeota archaeon]
MKEDKEIKAVIFDFDNTLEYFVSAEIKSENKVLRAIALEAKLPYNKFRKVFDKTKKGFLLEGKTPAFFSRTLWVKKALDTLNSHISLRRIIYFERLFWSELENNVRLYSDAKDILEYLYRKVPLGLVSDSDGKKEYKIKRVKKLKIDRFFKTIVTSDDTGFNKPDKSVFILCAKKLKIKPNNCLVVGDNPYADCIGGKNAEMQTACILRGSWKSHYESKLPKLKKYIDYHLKSLKDLKKIIV